MSELSPEAMQKVHELKKSYINSFPEKILYLENCWQNIEAENYSADTLEVLRKTCHKIAGSSGSYEILEISQAAKIIEQLCLKVKRDGLKVAINSQTGLKGHYVTLLKLLRSYT